MSATYMSQSTESNLRWHASVSLIDKTQGQQISISKKARKICRVYWTVLCYHPYLVSLLFGDLLSYISYDIFVFFSLVVLYMHPL